MEDNKEKEFITGKPRKCGFCKEKFEAGYPLYNHLNNKDEVCILNPKHPDYVKPPEKKKEKRTECNCMGYCNENCPMLNQ